MYNVNKEYNKNYYGARMDFKNEVYPLMGNIFDNILKPKNVIDVGCGHGILMDGLSCESVGIEASDEGFKQTKERGYEAHQIDLRLPLDFKRRFDLAISIEVAEHLEEEYADIFVDNLISLSNRILVTASPKVEQYHYNPQSKQYWIEKFSAKGFSLSETTNVLVETMREKIPKARGYLYNNLMFFENLSNKS